jgi:hypothetical protein
LASRAGGIPLMPERLRCISSFTAAFRCPKTASPFVTQSSLCRRQIVTRFRQYQGATDEMVCTNVRNGGEMIPDQNQIENKNYENKT